MAGITSDFLVLFSSVQFIVLTFKMEMASTFFAVPLTGENKINTTSVAKYAEIFSKTGTEMYSSCERV